MTKEEFDETRWHAGMFVTKQGAIYPVISIDFDHRRVEIYSGSYKWVDIDEIELVNIGE